MESISSSASFIESESLLDSTSRDSSTSEFLTRGQQLFGRWITIKARKGTNYHWRCKLCSTGQGSNSNRACIHLKENHIFIPEVSAAVSFYEENMQRVHGTTSIKRKMKRGREEETQVLASESYCPKITLANLIIAEDLPFSFVESRFLKDFSFAIANYVATTNDINLKSLHFGTRTTFNKKYIEPTCEQIESEALKALEKKSQTYGASLLHDGRKDVNGKSIELSLIYIHGSPPILFQLEVPNCQRKDKDYFSQYYENIFKKKNNKFSKLIDNIVCICTDGASAPFAAANIFASTNGILYCKCLLHIANRVLAHCFTSVEALRDMLNKANKVISFFKHEMVEDLLIPLAHKKVKCFAPTRMVYTQEVFATLVKLKGYLHEVIYIKDLVDQVNKNQILKAKREAALLVMNDTSFWLYSEFIGDVFEPLVKLGRENDRKYSNNEYALIMWNELSRKIEISMDSFPDIAYSTKLGIIHSIKNDMIHYHSKIHSACFFLSVMSLKLLKELNVKDRAMYNCIRSETISVLELLLQRYNIDCILIEVSPRSIDDATLVEDLKKLKIEMNKYLDDEDALNCSSSLIYWSTYQH